MSRAGLGLSEEELDQRGLSNAEKALYREELAKLRHSVRVRPEHIWQEYREEIGPYDEISADSLREVLEAQLIDARILGEKTLHVPRQIVERMLKFLRRQLAGQPTRPRGRPTKSWRNQRWEITAAEQVHAETVRLMKAGKMSVTIAERRALELIAPRYFIAPETLRDWTRQRPARRRRK